MESPEGLDWFCLNPVAAGLIGYADLKNGSVNLYDLYIMNEMLNYKEKVEDEAARKIRRERAIKRKV